VSDKSDKIAIVVGHSAWNDLQLMGHEFERAGLQILASVSGAIDLVDQARSLGADCIVFTPTLPGMTPALVQELLLNEDRPIAAVGLIPAGTQYAAEYQRHGMKGFVTTPLDPVQVQNLPKLVIEAVRLAQDERQARSYTPVTAEDAMAILDRGGWQQQTIAVFSPKGGVGKTTLSANLAAALGVIAQRPTLLIDADMSRANAHLLFDMPIENEPKNLFALYSRVVSDGARTGRYVVRSQTLQANVRKWKGKLDLLPGIPKPHMAGMDEFKGDDARTMEIFGEVVREARGFYDFRVIDVGPDFNQPLHWAAIQEANTVLLVVTPEKTAILDIANILPALAKHFGSLQKFRLVLNQFDERFGLDAKQVVAFLNGQVTILGSVPYAPVEARQSINQGEPVVLQKTLIPMAEAIIKLGGKFYPPLEQLGRKRPVAKRPGLFQRTKETFAS